MNKFLNISFIIILFLILITFVFLSSSNKKQKTFSIFILVLLFAFLICIITYCSRNSLVYQMSNIDNEKYLVRDLTDKKQASDMLAKIKNNIIVLTDYLTNNIDKYPEYKEYINILNKRTKRLNIEENEDNATTSYLNDKKELIICLRSKRNDEIHDLNLVMYVVLHEMAHMACPEYGHTQLFKKIFAFLTNRAMEINLYKKINFEQKNTEYCGIFLTNSIV